MRLGTEKRNNEVVYVMAYFIRRGIGKVLEMADWNGYSCGPKCFKSAHICSLADLLLFIRSFAP